MEISESHVSSLAEFSGDESSGGQAGGEERSKINFHGDSSSPSVSPSSTSFHSFSHLCTFFSDHCRSHWLPSALGAKSSGFPNDNDRSEIPNRDEVY